MDQFRTIISGLERNQASSKEEVVNQGTFFRLYEYSRLWAVGVGRGGLGLQGLTFSLEAPVSSVILHVLGKGEVDRRKEGHWGSLCKSDFLILLFFFFP